MGPITLARDGVWNAWRLRSEGLVAAVRRSAALARFGAHTFLSKSTPFQQDWMRTHVHEYLTPGAQKNAESYTLTATKGWPHRYALHGHWADTRYSFFLTIDDTAAAICGFDLPKASTPQDGVVIRQLQSLPRERSGTTSLRTLDRHTYGRLCGSAWEDVMVDALGAWSVDAGFRKLYIQPAYRNAYFITDRYPLSECSREKNNRLIARYDGTAQRRGFTTSPNAYDNWAHPLPLPGRDI